MCPPKNSDYRPDKIYETLKKLTNSVGTPLLNMQGPAEYEVQIRPDTTVSQGKFLPDPLRVGSYKAHPITIKAMRKDLFVAGADEFSDLQQMVVCSSCQTQLDLQFWLFCPFCEAALPKNVI